MAGRVASPLSSPLGGAPPSPRRPDAVDLVSLELLVAVVASGSINRAAAALQMSQPSASARLRRLERALALPLLRRSPRGATPTAEGALVADWAGGVVGGVEALLAGVRSLQADRRARLRVAASATIAEWLLPGWLATLAAEDPEVTVELAVANSDAVTLDVLRGEAALGFVETPERPQGLHCVLVGEDEMVAVVAPHHPWAGDGTRRQPGQLWSQPVVVRERGSGTRAAAEAALGDLGTHPRLLELRSPTALRTAVRSSTSVAIISRLAVADDLARGALVQLAVSGLPLRRPLWAVWSGSIGGKSAAATLLGVARRGVPRSRSGPH